MLALSRTSPQQKTFVGIPFMETPLGRCPLDVIRIIADEVFKSGKDNLYSLSNVCQRLRYVAADRKFWQREMQLLAGLISFSPGDSLTLRQFIQLAGITLSLFPIEKIAAVELSETERAKKYMRMIFYSITSIAWRSILSPIPDVLNQRTSPSIQSLCLPINASKRVVISGVPSFCVTKKLNIKLKNLSPKASRAFAGMLRASDLQELSLLCGPNFVRVDLFVLNAIGLNRNLQKLALKGIELTDEDCEVLSKGITNCSKLTELVLGRVACSKSSSTSFGKLLTAAPIKTLSVFSFAGNVLSQVAQCLSESSLLTVEFQTGVLEYESCSKLLEAKKRWRPEATLTLTKCIVPDNNLVSIVNELAQRK